MLDIVDKQYQVILNLTDFIALEPDSPISQSSLTIQLKQFDACWRMLTALVYPNSNSIQAMTV